MSGPQWFRLMAADVQWVGNTYHWPSSGNITPSSQVWINIESWPMGAAVGGRVVYSTDHGTSWRSVNMSKNGTAANNDRWHVNLGTFPCGTIIRYAVEITSPSRWDNDGGQDYRATVNTAPGEICSDSLNWNSSTASLSVSNLNSDARSYTLNSNAVRRPDITIGNPRNYSETSGKPIARTGNNLFDSLFSLAYHEMTNTLSVSQVSDDAYNDGVPIPCPETGTGGCFKTGVKWPYVWTRDSAYSIDLSLAQFDPVRAMNTLNFKVSDRRGNSGKPEIIQDTGSGGSWPVSSDRVVWGRAAWELLKYLDGNIRTDFRDLAYNAIVNTVENDRIALYDSRDGLYRGEQSFLDWREQTYPSWTTNSVVHIGMSKALSTNVNHWRILDVAATLADETDLTAVRDKYRAWADALKIAVNDQLWLASTGLYSTMKTTELDSSAIRRYDLLGEALSIIDGIGDSTKAASILQKYPHTVAGAPVSWPQIRDTKIYHNRSIWPLASAYWIKAAALSKNDQVVNHNLKSLMRGAALNLSNMENFEFISLSTMAKDPDNPSSGYGPDIDSEAQLWSVAGYLSVVVDVIFGRQVTQTGIRFQPFVTKYMRNSLFASASSITLNNVPYKGKTLNVEVLLPTKDASDNGYYNVSSVMLNGTTVTKDTYFTAAGLATTNQLQIQLVDANSLASSMTMIEDTGDYKRFWAPREPNKASVTLSGGLLTVSFDTNGESEVTFSIYRNGVQVVSGLTSTTWTDPHSGNHAVKTLCYSVEQKYSGSYPVDNYSHHSEPVCDWTPGTITEFTAGSGLNSLEGASTQSDHGRIHFNNWGLANQVLEATYVPSVTGKYAIQVVYGNAFNMVNSGITTCVKNIEVIDISNHLVASSVVMMPHLPDWDTWGDSSFAQASLTAGVPYKIFIKDFYNMSYLARNATYNHAGGSKGPVNRANISGLKILRMEQT